MSDYDGKSRRRAWAASLAVGALAAAFLAAAGCAKPAAAALPKGEAIIDAAGIVWPGADWPSATPESQGLDAAGTAGFLAEAAKPELGLNGVLVVRHGYVVAEAYFADFKPDTRHAQYSVTKSFTGTLVGIALDRGLLKLDERALARLDPDGAVPADAAKRAITVENLLTMSSGLSWEEGDPVYQAMYRTSDWVRFILDRPMAAAPGKEFLYNSGGSHLLSALVSAAALAAPGGTESAADGGPAASRPAFEWLLAPIGITDAVWETDPKSVPIGGWGLNLTPRQMARLGYLYLRGGEWNGKRIVSAAWVAAATTPRMVLDGLDYGYQWWIDPEEGSYAAHGRFGQLVYVLPRLDLVVVFTAMTGGSSGELDLIRRLLLPAVKG
jgi:CubicO group peptidase (beta-lactamase class C family)